MKVQTIVGIGLAVGLFLSGATLAKAAEAPVVSAKEIVSRLIPITGDEAQPRVELAIEFDFYDAQLTEKAEQQVRELGIALRSEGLKDARFAIEGHTDAAGKESYNKQLSRERAKAVYYYLIQEMGIDKRRLEIRGFGSSRLKNKADPLASENRRVEVVNLSAGAASVKSVDKPKGYEAIQ